MREVYLMNSERRKIILCTNPGLQPIRIDRTRKRRRHTLPIFGLRPPPKRTGLPYYRCCITFCTLSKRQGMSVVDQDTVRCCSIIEHYLTCGGLASIRRRDYSKNEQLLRDDIQLFLLSLGPLARCCRPRQSGSRIRLKRLLPHIGQSCRLYPVPYCIQYHTVLTTT